VSGERERNVVILGGGKKLCPSTKKFLLAKGIGKMKFHLLTN